MKILLTGNEGFIGKRLEVRLRSMGYEIQGFDVKAQGFDDDLTSTDWLQCYKEEIADNHYDLIAHAGGIAQPHFKSPDIFFWNTETTQILAEKSAKDGSRFVFFSTGMAINPDTLYGWSKRLSEYIVADRCTNYCNLRLMAVFGTKKSEYRRNPLSVPDLIANGGLKYIYEGYLRDFVHIDDVISSVSKAVDSNIVGTYQLGTGRPYSTKELVDAWGFAVNAEVKPLPEGFTKEITAIEPRLPTLEISHNPVDWLRKKSKESSRIFLC